ncbi:N-acetyltransferase [Limisalsivibrio acetivorans]|uniref:N-acetyltransferase n=1 Tax=Limisalsivibrio acetivorans TaxID=1304888 RepID=UPI0003B592FA|nr:acyltransferase [Limisalsivibrio acetivorans]
MNSIIHETAAIGDNCTIGNFTTISENVTVGEGCVIGNNVVIHPDSIIGDNVRIDDHAVIGKLPMRAANSAITKEMELSPANVGSNCIIGTSTVIYRGCTLGEKVLAADLATVRENVTVGSYTIIGRGVAIENLVEIGSYCKIETNVYICAYSEIADYCFVAPCVATSNDNFLGRSEKRFELYGGVRIKKGGRIGVNATILPGKTIAEDTVIAGGALLTKDTEPESIYAGTPAKYFRDVPEDELLKNQKPKEKK